MGQGTRKEFARLNSSFRKRIQTMWKTFEVSGHGLRGSNSRVKLWHGLGVIALVFIVLWCFLLIFSYLPWEEKLDPKNWQGFVPENLVIAFVVFGLFIIPGMFYIAWVKFLRRLASHKNIS